MLLKQVFKNKLFLAGFILLIIGSGPLFVTGGNPIILGMMAGLSFWPSLGMMVIGVYNEIKSNSEKSKTKHGS